MPFDIGIWEWVVVAVIALIVVGPEDLPKMFHRIGGWVGKARSMSDEFRRTLDSAVDDSGINTIAKDLKQTEMDIRNAARMEELEASARELENDIKGELADANKAAKSASRKAELDEDALDEIERQEAKARSEAIRAKADAVKAEARAKMLREQLEKAEKDMETASAKISAEVSTKAKATKAKAKKPATKANAAKTVAKSPAKTTKATPSKAATKTAKATAKSSKPAKPKARSTKTDSAKKTAAE